MDSFAKPAQPSSGQEKIFSYEFCALCVIIFATYCNITVYYDLFVYLGTLGISESLRGSVISASSLATIACFALLSPFLHAGNARTGIYLGACLLIGCGVSFLFARSYPALIALRLVNGTGIYLLTASTLSLLVGCIPASRSGQAFGFYSLFPLLPYSVVPVLFDWLHKYLSSSAKAYALMSLCLLPVLAMNFFLGQRPGKSSLFKANPLGFKDLFASLSTSSTALLLLINAIYYLNYSALFFLAKPLFDARGLGGVGLFFTLQTVLMLALRFFANRVFDAFDKLVLIRASFSLTAAGFLVMYFFDGLKAELAAALLIGLGMGLAAPSLNALMFSISSEKYRALNSNLMMMSLHAGNLSGPLLGGAAVAWLGYEGFLACGAVSLGLGLILGFFFRSRCRAQTGQSCS